MKSSTIIIIVVVIAVIGFAVYWFGFRKTEEKPATETQPKKDAEKAGSGALDEAKKIASDLKAKSDAKAADNAKKADSLIKNMNSNKVSPSSDAAKDFKDRMKKMGYNLNYDAVTNSWSYSKR